MYELTIGWYGIDESFDTTREYKFSSEYLAHIKVAAQNPDWYTITKNGRYIKHGDKGRWQF